MTEKRKSERLNDFNEITVSVMSVDKNFPKEKVCYNYSENISLLGAKIRGNILLPVDALLKIDFTLKTLKKQITAIGKVRWIKMIIQDKYYEAGVEFVDTPNEAIQKIEEYISWKKKQKSFYTSGLKFLISAKFNEPESK